MGATSTRRTPRKSMLCSEVTSTRAFELLRAAQLKDPDWQKRRERERRAAAAEARLGGLSAAQKSFLAGNKPVSK